MNVELPGTKNLFWMPSIIFGESYHFDRDALIKSMNADGIGLRPFFYPVSMFSMFESAEDNVVSWSLYKKGINLPSYHDMRKEEVGVVVSELLKNIN
jgi:perosamine synthetase